MPTKLTTSPTSSKVANLPILLRQVPEALGGDRQVSEARYVCCVTCKRTYLQSEVNANYTCTDEEYFCRDKICEVRSLCSLPLPSVINHFLQLGYLTAICTDLYYAPFEQVTKPINLWIYLVLMSGTFTINMTYLFQRNSLLLFPWIRHKETAQSNPALLVCDTLKLTWKTAGGDVRQHILSSMMKIYRWHTRQELWVLWLWRSETGTKRRKRLNSRW